MLLILTVLLVLAGLVLLIVGFVQNSVGYIYVSIACAVVAGLVLFVFNRASRRRFAKPRAEAASTPAPTASATQTASATEAPPATAGVLIPDRGGDEAASWSPQPAATPPASSGEDRSWASLGGAATIGADEDLAATVLPSDPADEAGPPDEPVPLVASASGADELEDEDEDFDDEWDDEPVFPIADYDDLRVGEILPLLDELDPDELAEVRDREVAGKARGMILRRCAGLLGEPAPAPGRAAAKAPARKAAAAPAAKAGTAKKAAPTKAVKKVAPTKAAPAKRAPAKKAVAPTTAAQVAKAAPVSTTVPVKKAPASTKAAPTKAAPPTKAVPPTKAAPTKAAPAKKAAAKSAAVKKVPVAKAAPAKRAGRVPPSGA